MNKTVKVKLPEDHIYDNTLDLRRKTFIFPGIKASQDVKDVLEKLKVKAVIKIRAYILEQISKLRKPMTNYHIPQNALLKHKCVILKTLLYQHFDYS